MSKFQLAIIVIFGLCIVGGVIAFSVYKGSGGTPQDIVVWGTPSSDVWNSWYASIPLYHDKLIHASYVQISEANFDRELTDAIAEGRGPDLVLAFQDRILKNQNKIVPIPYASFSQRDFQNTFIDAAQALMTPAGELGVPIVVDPMVLYYNKDIFASNAIVNPPTHWEEIYPIAQNITKRDKSGNVTLSAIPFGESSNVLYAKNILAILTMQAGGKVVEDTPVFIRAAIANQYNLPYAPGPAALLFFTQFSNPAKVFYTWNRSLPDSLTRFAAGDSAMLVAFASDLQKIKDRNPNLSFDIAALPQASGAAREMTYGRLLALAVPKGTAKTAAAFQAMFSMMDAQSSPALAAVLSLPPARRDALSVRPADPLQDVFYQSAIKAVSWKDPDSAATDALFGTMIDTVTSGRGAVEAAVNKAQGDFQSLIDSLSTNTTANAIQ